MALNPPRITDQDQAFFQALDRRNAAPNQAIFERFSRYAEYKVVLHVASAGDEVDSCPWRDATEICQLLNKAALELCGSSCHQGSTMRLFSQIGTSYWASKFAIEYLAQFAESESRDTRRNG